MKRHEFLKELVEAGCYLRDAAVATIYANPANGKRRRFPGTMKSRTLSAT